MVTHYKCIMSYYASVGMRVQFNTKPIFAWTIYWLNNDKRDYTEVSSDFILKHCLASFLMFLVFFLSEGFQSLVTMEPLWMLGLVMCVALMDIILMGVDRFVVVVVMSWTHCCQPITMVIFVLVLAFEIGHILSMPFHCFWHHKIQVKSQLEYI